MASAATGVTKKHTRSRGRAKRAHDPYASVYGRISWQMFRQRPWMQAGKLDESTVGKYVVVFGSVDKVRPLSKTSAMVVLLNQTETVRCMIVASAEEGITTQMVRFAVTMRQGTYIDVEGFVSLPGSGKHIHIPGITQQVVIQVRKLHTIGTLQDGSRLDAASLNSSSSITSRPSDMLEDKPEVELLWGAGNIGLSLEPEDQALHHISTRQQLGTMASATASIIKKHTRSRGRAKRSNDPYVSVYGRISWQMFRQRPWIQAGKLDESAVGKFVVVFGSVDKVRPLSKTSAMVVLLNQTETVRCMIVASAEEGITTQMVRFAVTMRQGTYIDVEGVISLPGSGKHIHIPGITQHMVIQVRKLHTIGTRQDGSRLDAASQNPSASITSRPSDMLDDKPVGREVVLWRARNMGLSVESEYRALHHIWTRQQLAMLVSATVGVTKKHTTSRGTAKRAHDPYASVYGHISWQMFRQRPWLQAGKLDESMVGKYVMVFGSVDKVQPLSKTSVMVVLLNQTETVRCMIVASAGEGITTEMMRFAVTMCQGTYIDVEGVVSLPGSSKHIHIPGITQQVVIQVRKLHTIGTRQDGSRLDASQYSSINITSRPSNMIGLEEELQVREK